MSDFPVSIGCRITHPTNDKLQVLSQQTGLSSSDLLREALNAYLGLHTPDKVDSMTKRISALERKVNNLTRIVNQ